MASRTNRPARNGQTVADKSFAAKLKDALDKRDFVKVERLFNQYGTYLELIEPGA